MNDSIVDAFRIGHLYIVEFLTSCFPVTNVAYSYLAFHRFRKEEIVGKIEK
jgi:hypothetical protein